MQLNTREQILLVVGALALVVAVAAIGGLVVAVNVAEVAALRWWALVATLAAPLAAAIAFWLGRQEARAHVAGLTQGIEAVHGAAQGTVSVAQRAADIRVTSAQRLRQRPTPALQQFILPGMMGGNSSGLILPPAHDDEEVEV